MIQHRNTAGALFLLLSRRLLLLTSWSGSYRFCTYGFLKNPTTATSLSSSSSYFSGHQKANTATTDVFANQKNQRSNDNVPSECNVDEAYKPYRGSQPPEALPEIFIPYVLPQQQTKHEEMKKEGNTPIIDEHLLWVPQTDCVSFRPLCLCVSGGYYVNLLRVRGSGVLSRHKHPGPVHGHVLKGQWKYLEHNWVATEGSYVFEPPGEIHTLIVPDGVEEMITLFHVTGSLLYCDTDGNVIGADDVFTKLDLAKKHYFKVGLGEDFVQQFVR